MPKEKPAMAATIARAIENEQIHDTPSTKTCQCPNCGFDGLPDLFEPGWPDELHELIAKHSELGVRESLPINYRDARYLLNRLRRMK